MQSLARTYANHLANRKFSEVAELVEAPDLRAVGSYEEPVNLLCPTRRRFDKALLQLSDLLYF